MSSLKKTLGVAAVLADIMLLNTGCFSGVVDLDDDFTHSGNVEAAAEFSRILPLGSQSAIRVFGANGSIHVWGDPTAQEVTLKGVRRVRSDTHSDARAHLPNLRVEATARPSEIEIRTVQPRNADGRSYLVDYDISVPAHLAASVTNGNGTVLIDGLVADVDVTNGNGKVELVDVEGSHWVSLGNGELSAWAHLPAGGKIVHSVGNGSVFLSVQPQVSASFGARVGNGTITLTGLDLHQVVSGERELKGVLGSGDGLIDLSAGNGQIRVQGG